MPSSAEISIGRYQHRESLIHNLDPRTKLLMLLILVISVFLARYLRGLVVTFLFLISAILLSRLSLRAILRELRLISWLIVSIFIIHIMFTGDNFRPTWAGIHTGLIVIFRFALIVMGAAVLTSTTVPLSLSDAISSALRPLRKIGLPVHQFPIMVAIILHFIPSLLDEGQRLVLAQKARGTEISKRSFLLKLKSLIPVIIPLWRSSFRRADDLAVGMESRCYSGGFRTHLYGLAFRFSDLVAIILSAAMIPLVILTNVNSI